MLELARLESDEAAGEMQEMENDEDSQQQAAPAHGHGAPGCFDIFSIFVSHGTRSPIHSSELHRSRNMKEYADEKHDPDQPEKLSVPEFRPAHLAQKSRVGVDFFRSGKDFEVPNHVSDNEKDQHSARYRHHNFFADHARPDRHQSIARAWVLLRLR